MNYDLSIRARMAIGFGLVLALLLLALGFTLVKLRQMDHYEHEVAYVIGERANQATAIQTAFLNQSIAIHSYIATRDPGYLQDYRQQMTVRQGAIERLRRLPRNADGDRIFTSIQATTAEFERQVNQIMPLLELRTPPAELPALENQLRGLRTKLIKATRDLTDLQTQKRLAAAANLDAIRRILLNTLLALFSIIILISFGAALMTIHAIRHPARQLADAIGALERGDYEPARALGEKFMPRGVPVRNELHALAGALGRMAGVMNQRERRLAADNRLAMVLASTLDPHELAAGALGEILENIRDHGGAVYLMDREQNTLRLTAAQALAGPEELSPEGKAVRQALAVTDAPSLSPSSAGLPFRMAGSEAGGPNFIVCTMPLAFHNHPFGLLVLAGAEEPDADGRAFLEHAAHHLSVGLQNALTHRDATRLAEELGLKNRQLKLQNEVLHAQGRQLQAQSEQLRHQNAQLAEADRRKNEFLAMLAHELRNPLSAISNAHCVLERGPLREEQAQRMRVIVTRQIHHLSRLIEDLLDVSRITRGLVRLRKEIVDLNQAARNAAESCRGLFESRQQTLAVTPNDEEVWVDADPTRLEQIIDNLLGNAVKYSEPRSRTVLTVAREGTWATVRVRDAGLGIAPDLLPHVFDLFQQAESGPDRAKGGLGIGLTMVQALVQMHGGQVEAHSEGVGRGSEFVIRLPLAQPAGIQAAEVPGQNAGA